MLARTAALGAILLVATAAGAQLQYRLTELRGFKGEIGNSPQGINDLGQITGDAVDVDHFEGYLKTGNLMVRLGSLGVGPVTGFAVNELGQVAGAGSVDGSSARGFIYTNGKLQDIGVLEGGWESTALAINDLGHAVGMSKNEGIERAVIYRDGVLTSLGTLGGEKSSALGINNAGQIVGVSNQHIGQFDHRAFLYENGVMTSLGTLGGSYSEARAINSVGQIVGYSFKQGGSAPFMFQNGTMSDLGTLGGSNGEAWAINESGQVVGWSTTSSFDFHGFLYRDSVMHDLNDLLDATGADWEISRAVAINESGVILASAHFQGSPFARGVMLEPVPEPASIIALAVGALALSTRIRRRRR